MQKGKKSSAIRGVYVVKQSRDHKGSHLLDRDGKERKVIIETKTPEQAFPKSSQNS